MIRLRITADGCVRGMWADALDFVALGKTDVRRASHVEFDRRQQCWCVREAQPLGRVRRWIQRLSGRPLCRVVHRARTRAAALDWEHRHFQPGGRGWPAFNKSG